MKTTFGTKKIVALVALIALLACCIVLTLTLGLTGTEQDALVSTVVPNDTAKADDNVILVGSGDDFRKVFNNAPAESVLRLTGDVEYTSKPTVDKNITIDLNGHVLKYGYANEMGSSGAISVSEGYTLTLTDTSIGSSNKITDPNTSKEVTIESGVFVGGVYIESGTFNFDSGAIAGGIGSSYIVNIFDNYGNATSVFNMSGTATICNSKSKRGIVNVGASSGPRAIFNMSGGSITNNVDDNCAVRITYHGVFNMSGGSIDHNVCGSLGAIYVTDEGSTFNMSGGSITYNQCTATGASGGVWAKSSTIIELSGNPVISDNTSNGVVRNLYSDNREFVYNIVGQLKPGTHIGITWNRDVTRSETLPLTSGFLDSDNGLDEAQYFFSDDTNYKIGLNGTELYPVDPDNNSYGTIVLKRQGEPDLNFTSFYGVVNYLQEGDTIQLVDNSTYYTPCPINTNNITLDLNGHVLKYKGTLNTIGSEYALRISSTGNYTFTLTDSSNGASNPIDDPTNGGQSIDIPSGVFLGNIRVEGGIFNFDSGAIAGCSSTSDFYVVYTCNTAQFNMSGTATICNNLSYSTVWFGSSDTLTMTGGSITNNVGTYFGGINLNSGNFNMSGGSITDNQSIMPNSSSYSYVSAGGVYIKNSDTIFSLTGNPIITDNTEGGVACNLKVNRSANIVIKEKLAEGAKIGITSLDRSSSQPLTSGFTDSGNTMHEADYFFSDIAEYTLVIFNNELNVIATSVYETYVAARINSKGVLVNYYNEFRRAWDALEEGDTIRLIADAFSDRRYSTAINNTTLDLNGHVLEFSKDLMTSTSSVAISVYDNCTFTLTDSSRGASNEIYDPTTGDTVTIYSGVMVGGGICAGGSNRGICYFEAGAIAGCIGKNNGELNVIRVYSDGIFYMSGTATICNNYALSPVYLDGGIFNMSGGSITNNKTTDSSSRRQVAAGIYIDYAGTLNLSGGSITDNVGYNFGGGVYVASGGTINLSDNPIVENNQRGDNYVSNIYMADVEALINIVGQIADGAKIGIARNYSRDLTSAVTSGFASNYNGTAQAKYFVSDDEDYKLSMKGDGELYFELVQNVAEVIHSSGGSTKYMDFEEAWKALQDGDTIKLLASTDFSNPLTLAANNVTLDLNGFELISLVPSGYGITVPSGYSLTIKDSQVGIASTRITDPTIEIDDKEEVDNTIVISSGIYTGTISVAGTLTFNSGAIAGLNIEDNVVNVTSNGKFNMAGRAQIIANKTTAHIVYVENGTLAMTGGRIEGNMATYAVYVEASAGMKLSGNPLVADNQTATGVTANVYLSSGALITFDGQLTTGAYIGLTIDATGSICFTSGYEAGNNGEAEVDYIVADVKGKCIGLKAGELYFGTHAFSGVCDNCGKCINHLIVSVSAQSPNCSRQGWDAHYMCYTCGKHYTDKEGTEIYTDFKSPNGVHTWGAWSDAGNGNHKHTCINGCNTTEEFVHDFSGKYVLASEGNGHYHVCSVIGCDAHDELQAHTWTATANWPDSASNSTVDSILTNLVVTLECSGCKDQHTFQTTDEETISISKNEITKANCGIAGSADFELTVNYDTLQGYTLSKDYTLAATGNHDYSEWETTEDTHSSKCSVCGDTLTAAPHKFTWTPGDGIKHDGACVCGSTKSHDAGIPTTWTDSKDGTHHEGECTDEECDIIIKQEHGELDWVTDKATGHYQECETCGYTTQPQAHTYDGAQYVQAGDQHYQECTDTHCDYKNYSSHIYGKWSNSDDTNHTHSCVCGASEEDTHNWTVSVNWPSGTYTNDTINSVLDGLTLTLTCGDCSTTREFNAESGEDVFSVTPDINEATCGASGTAKFTVKVTFNGNEYSNESQTYTLQSTGDHKYEDNWTDGNNGKHYRDCLYGCGQQGRQEQPHVFDEAPYVSDGIGGHYQVCTANGCEAHSNTVGHVWKQEEGADEDGWVIDEQPTCEGTGLKHRACSLCEYEENDVSIPATGHSYKLDTGKGDHNDGIEWKLSEDGKNIVNVIIHLVCATDECGETTTATINGDSKYISYEAEGDSSCTTPAKTKYTVTVTTQMLEEVLASQLGNDHIALEQEGVQSSVSIDKDTPNGHKWVVKFVWNTDGDTPTATVQIKCETCQISFVVEEVEVTSVSTPATCTKADETVYTAKIDVSAIENENIQKGLDKFYVDGKPDAIDGEITDTYTVTGKALEHHLVWKYDEEGNHWQECDREDCDKEGNYKTEPTKHDDWEITWTWGDSEADLDNLTLYIKCKTCEAEHMFSKEDLQVEQGVKNDPTCQKDGDVTYNASVTYWGKEFSGEHTYTLGKGDHKWSTDWSRNEFTHWHECEYECGTKQPDSEEGHEWGDEGCIKCGMPKDSELEDAKEKATGDIEKKRAEAEAEIRGLPFLSDEEKEDFVNQVNQAAADAKKKIGEANSQDDVNTAITEGEAEIDEIVDAARKQNDANEKKAKAEAIEALEQKKKESKETIEQRRKDGELTDAEAEYLDSLIDDAFDDACNNVQNAKTPSGVTTARDDGIDEMDRISKLKGSQDPDGDNEILDEKKERAEHDLKEYAEKKKNDIENRQDIDSDEKEFLQGLIDEELERALDEIDSATTLDEVDGIVKESKKEMDRIAGLGGENNGPGEDQILDEKKERAEHDLREYAEKKKNDIENRSDLDEDEKEYLQGLIDEELERALEEIDNAESLGEVDEIVKDSKAEMDRIAGLGGDNNGPGEDQILDEKKERAKKELDDYADEKKGEIDDRDDLDDDEKKDLKDRIDDELKNAKDKVDEAENDDEIKDAVDEGKEKMDEIAKSGGNGNGGEDDDDLAKKKRDAKDELEKAAKRAQDFVDSRTDLTDDEKEILKDIIEHEKERGEAAIDRAESADEVDDELQKAKDIIDRVANIAKGNVDLEKKKDEAKDILEKAAKKAKDEIDARTDLDPEQKETLKEIVDHEKERAQDAVDRSTTIDEVEEELQKGLDMIDRVAHLAKGDVKNEKAKDDAKRELEKAARAAKKTVNSREDLTDEQKDILKDRIDDELQDAYDEVDFAETEEEIRSAVDTGKANMDRIANTIFTPKGAFDIGISVVSLTAQILIFAIALIADKSKKKKEQ